LFEESTPKTVSNFLEFVSGTKMNAKNNIPLCYKDSKVSRILAGGWIQLGGMSKKVNFRYT